MALFTRSECPCLIEICKHPGIEHDDRLGCQHVNPDGQKCGCIAYKPKLVPGCVLRATFVIESNRVTKVVRILRVGRKSVLVRLLEDIDFPGWRFWAAGTEIWIDRWSSIFEGV